MSRRTGWQLAALLIVSGGHAFFAVPAAADLASELEALNPAVLSGDERQQAQQQVSEWIEQERLRLIGVENQAWSEVDSRRQWEAFRDMRIGKLKSQLHAAGHDRAAEILIHTTGRHEGDGFVVENIVYHNRRGLWISANLYRPAQAGSAMPSILISHSHHNPKTQGELQTMGITWARNGCVVLVPDHLGHGERRQHPFASSDDYPGSFRRGRQDYYFRYNTNLHLRSVGDSLMSWLVEDLRCGVGLLESLDGVDASKTILIGAVAGGGDPAGVTAAVDERIEAVIPFNFGGPQPDYAIPAGAQEKFYFFGVAYWEQTRCLPRGGRDGFAHWVIAAAAAPRRLCYAHEFGWDRERDPAFPRIEKVFSFYDASERLGFATGKGTLKGRPPESSHCNNVGAYHRRGIYPLLEKWFGMPVPADEAEPPFSAEELTCFTPEVLAKIEHRPAKEAARAYAEEIAAAKQGELDWGHLHEGWLRQLGAITAYSKPKVLSHDTNAGESLRVERIVLESPGEIAVPLLVLTSKQPADPKRPVVVAISRQGKAGLLEQRREEIEKLLAGGAVVCLPDLRETGATRSGTDLSRGSRATTLSCRAEVLGRTTMGGRLEDLLMVLRYVRSRGDAGRVSLWGESLAAPNPADRSEVVPLGIGNPNTFGEPGAAHLALLAALFDENVSAVVAGGGMDSFYSVLDSEFLYVPHDAVISSPELGDVDDLAQAIAPCRVLRHSSINGLNRRVDDAERPDVAEWLLK